MQIARGPMARGDGLAKWVAPTAGRRGMAWALVLLVLHAGSAAAAENIGGKPDSAYLAAVRGLRLQAEISYLPPAAPLDVQVAPDDQTSRRVAPPPNGGPFLDT